MILSLSICAYLEAMKAFPNRIIIIKLTFYLKVLSKGV